MHIVAIIGCGRISDAAHFPALSEMKDVRIKYACDLIREKADLPLRTHQAAVPGQAHTPLRKAVASRPESFVFSEMIFQIAVLVTLIHNHRVCMNIHFRRKLCRVLLHRRDKYLYLHIVRP